MDDRQTPAPARDALDDKANRIFAGKVVRKDLVRKVKVGANVPVFVLEYLLGKYCASSDELAIQMGLQVVNQTLADNYIRPDESTRAQSRVKEEGRYCFIDKVKVRLLDSEYWAEAVNFGDSFLHIPTHYVREYDRILMGGIWAQIDLRFEYDAESRGRHPFWIDRLSPIQIATFDLDEYRSLRREFSLEEWIDLLVRSMGYEPSRMERRLKWLFLVRLIPLAERNYNLVELGPRGTGKSYVIQEISPYGALLTGPTTVANLFGHMSGKQKGMVSIWDVVGFDEVADLQKMPKEVITTLKTYCESGTFQRGKEAASGDASLVLFGNTQQPIEVMVQTGHLFAPMPDVIRDDMAFIDRLHFYLPGWEIPKMRNELFTDHYGFVVDYLAEALRAMRKHNFSEVIDLLNNRVEAEMGVAFFVAAFSAIRKSPVTAATLILGDMSIQGNVKPLRSLVEPLQVARDNGAKRALIPIENKRNFLEVSADIIEQVDPVFYGEPKAAAFKALRMS